MDKLVIATPFASDNLILKYKDSKFIGVEKGAKKVVDLGLKNELIVSDFDSVPLANFTNKVDKKTIIKLPNEKDYSDTEFAIVKAKELFSFSKIIILGSLKGRFDHSYALLLLLKKYCNDNVVLEDDNNEIHYYQEGEFSLDKNDFTYLGLFGFPYANVSLDGVYYEVKNMDLSFNETKAISNSFTEEKVAIKVNKGELLLVLSKDE